MAETDMMPPALIIGYRRSDLMQQVFERMVDAGIEKVYVALDGPKSKDIQQECDAVKALVTDFHDSGRFKSFQLNCAASNMGCKNRVESAIDWAFEQEDELIILEDDTLPDLKWFKWCKALLDQYKDESAVAMITAQNPLVQWPAGSSGYFLSRNSCIWGWATWKNRWHAYRETAFKTNDDSIRQRWQDVEGVGEYRSYLSRMQLGKAIDTWDINWALWMEQEHKYNIVPSQNCVFNLGWDNRATHLNDSTDFRTNLNIYGGTPLGYQQLQPGTFDILMLLLDMICNTTILEQPRRWKMLANNANRLEFPGNTQGWASYFLPFKLKNYTLQLLDHLEIYIEAPDALRSLNRLKSTLQS